MADLYKALRNADAAGDIEAAERIAQMIRAEEARDPTLAERALGVGETALQVGSSIIAEPVAGLMGMGAQMVDGGSAGGQMVDVVRENLTYQPRTSEGIATSQSLGEALKPIAEGIEGAEDWLGDEVFELTESPALAAAAKALPTATLELLGVGVGRKIAKGSKSLKPVPLQPVSKRQVSNALVESAPDIQTLKDTSRAIYREIDDLGVTLKRGSFSNLVGRVIRKARKERVNPNRTPEAYGAMQEFLKEINNIEGRTILDVDDLRAVAQDAASSRTPADARIGMIMLDEIDDFLDKVPESAFLGDEAAKASKVGEKYRAARNLWGRARRAELIEEAFYKAGLQESGLENGLRTQINQILRNPKRRRFFTKEELTAMEEVSKGTTAQNVLKLVGRLGFSEGRATNILGGLGGYFAVGPAGPIVGGISRKLAQRATQKGFDLSDAIIRAGNDGAKVAEAYLKITPKAARDSFELSTLLTDPRINLTPLLDSADKLTREAAEIARGQRAVTISESIGAAAPVVATQNQNQ